MNSILGRASQLSMLLKVLWQRAKPAVMPNSIYTRELPSDQQAVDIFRDEWASRIPGRLVSGPGPMFEGDARPQWFADRIGGLQGRTVLELGPLEGGHSYQLERMGALVTGVEGNRLAFQRCLITKNILGMRAKFLFGDFVRYLAEGQDRFDVVFASGVLYHMQDPLKVLHDICRTADHVYLWTHYFDREQIDASPVARRAFASDMTKTFEVDGLSVLGHQQRYTTGLLTYFMPGFCGGMKRSTYWLQLDDIKAAFTRFGFEIVGIELNPSDTPHGPNVSIAARRHDRG